MIKHMSSKLWDEITYPFPNFVGNCTIEVWGWITNVMPYFIMLGSKLIHVSKRVCGQTRIFDIHIDYVLTPAKMFLCDELV